MKFYTQNMSRPPRYRWRTWLRGLLPWKLAAFFPAGPEDCGDHEWFRADDDTDLCRHCLVGEREHVHTPIDWDSDLWRELSRLADEGDEDYQQLIAKLQREEAEAQRAA
jgi:hypothetical protein